MRKAYDRVWRNGLWNRVWREGVRGKMWRVMKDLYSGTQNCVIVGGEKTDFFEVEEGVRQGCILSPTLFSIYINGVVREILEKGKGIDVGGEKLAILLYADDIVIIANSAEELQRNMEIMTEWGRKWKCTFNKKKSQVVVFGSRKKKEMKWFLGGGEIKQVNKYKYLGIDMKGNLKWGDYKKRQLEKAEGRLNFVGAMGINSGMLSVKAADKVWKALVRPIVEYGAEIWGGGDWEDGEKLQRSMGKRILGLKESTTNEVVRGEMGWWSMKARRDMIRLRYWRKILNMGQERLTKKVYEWELRLGVDRSWKGYTRELLDTLGLGAYWDKQKIDMSKDEWNRLITERIHKREEEDWKIKMKHKSKLRTYRKVKDKLEVEGYLRSKDVEGRRMLARIRSGTNKLRIETGRHTGLEADDRKCWFGCGKTEDERHFLLECKMYDDFRNELIRGVGEEKYKGREIEVMMGKGKEEETGEAIIYIKKAMARRERILRFRNN